MSWKKPGSLAFRLTAWYAASAFLLLLVGTGILYWQLETESDTEDDQYLAEKVSTLRTLLAKNDFRTVEWEVHGESSAWPGVALLSRVLDEGGRIVAETDGMSAELPPASFPPGSIDFRGARGRMFRVASERVPGYTVQVALEVTYEANLLAAFRRRLWTVLGAGLIVAALIGYGIARRGIRPVEEIARTARGIRPTTLNERVGTAGLPSELAELAGTFNAMLDRLQEAFDRLSRFSSDIAHELRTPVNNLRGEVEVALAKPRAADEYRDVLGSSLEECVRLSRLIDSLLFLARAENPQTEIRRERVDIARELAAVRDFYEPAAAEAGVALELRAPDAVPADVDRTLFQRAVGNLIENALAHTPGGGTVALSAARENGRLLVSVSDTGCGIPREHLARVFDRFHRVDPARSNESGGAGLGLAIVKSVAALHGGTAEIESEPGRGTRVTLAFQMTNS